MSEAQADNDSKRGHVVDPMAEPVESVDGMRNLRETANRSLISMLTKNEGIFNASKLTAELAKITDGILADPYGDEAYKTLIEDGYLFKAVEGLTQVYWLADKEYREQAEEITDGAMGRAYLLHDLIEKDWNIYATAEGIITDFRSLESIEDPYERIDAINASLDNVPPIEEQYKTLHGLISAGEFEPTLNKAIEKITAKPIKTSDFPLDKPNRVIWDCLETTDGGGQLAFNIAVEESGSDKEINIAYAIDFDELDKIPNLKITRKLTRYDKRAHNAVAALFNAGYKVMGIRQIYNAMGYKGSAGKSDIEKINNSLTKMAGANIYIDNIEEADAYKSKPHFKYDGKLIPMERVTAEINGNITDGAIHLYREPPLMTFARERKQITTITVGLLNSPLNKTDNNIRLEDYLIERIAHIKNGKQKSKILYETLFKNIQANTRKQRQRAKENAAKFLDHCIKEKFIKGYEPLEDGIQIRP